MAGESKTPLLKLVLLAVAVAAIAFAYFYAQKEQQLIDESAQGDRWQNRADSHRIVTNDVETPEASSSSIEDELIQLRASLNQRRAANAKTFGAAEGEVTEAQAASLKDLLRQSNRALAGQYTRKQIHLIVPAMRQMLADPTSDAVVKEGSSAQLSWRVHLLPFIQQQALYDRFHLDEGWDSDHNQALVENMPMLYRGLFDKPSAKVTRVLAVDAPGALGSDGRLREMNEVKDPDSDTLALVIAGNKHAQPWTKPADFSVTEETFSEAMAGMPKPTYWVGTIEGAALDIHYQGSFSTFHQLMTIGGGEKGAVDTMIKEKFQLSKAE